MPPASIYPKQSRLSKPEPEEAGCSPTAPLKPSKATGSPASPSTSSKKTFASSSNPPANSVCPYYGTSLVHQLYNKLQSDGKGGLGNHALIQALEDLSGKHLEKKA